MNEILTFSGQLIDPFKPDINKININDIANSLSRQCRFGGHLRWFYSVAEHSLRVASKLPHELKLTGLLHDAAEAYLLDLPRPIKNRLPGYKEAEEHLLQIIMQKYGGIYPLPAQVIKADEDVLQWEFEYVVSENKPDAPGLYNSMGYSMANRLFMNRFVEYTKIGGLDGK